MPASVSVPVLPLVVARAPWGELLRTWRFCFALSQPEAARVIGVPYKTLEKWEQGSMRPSGANLAKLSQRFWGGGS
ncbi:MAG TPA: helix-turn-helix domain-containing protein [Verrucomicrobiae bacterium]|nr:helix-turn-helix domain-containing protein [Verrucomicrobiae bacterium]